MFTKSNFFLYFKYIFFKNKFFFLQATANQKNNIFLNFPNTNFYYLILHFKLSSLFYSTQLIDAYAYETPSTSILTPPTTILTYMFYHIQKQKRFFCFMQIKNLLSTPSSIAELFTNANWLEREINELSGIFFYQKKDLRNLLLQYGEQLHPLRKNTPSIGFKEIYYDSLSDFLIQTNVTVQF